MAVALTHSPDRCTYCTLLFDASNRKTHSGKIGKRIVSTRPSTCGFVKSGLYAHFAPFFSLVSREEFPQVVVVSSDTRVPGFAHLGKVREMLLIQYFICTDIEKEPLPHVWGRGLGAPMGIGHNSACYKRACGDNPRLLSDRFWPSPPLDLPAYPIRAHEAEDPSGSCRRAGTFVL